MNTKILINRVLLLLILIVAFTLAACTPDLKSIFSTPTPAATATATATLTPVATPTLTATPFPQSGQLEKSVADGLAVLSWKMTEDNYCSIKVVFEGDPRTSGEYINQDHPGKPCTKEDVADLLGRFRDFGRSMLSDWHLELIDLFLAELR